MAIWQYQLFIVPKQNLIFYLDNSNKINNDNFNEIICWEHSQLNIENFNIISPYLPIRKSWSNNIILFGYEDANCVEVFSKDDKVEISARIDLRYNPIKTVETLCRFAQATDSVFLNSNFSIIISNIEVVLEDIAKFPTYKAFIEICKRHSK